MLIYILDFTGVFFAFIATILFIRINKWAWLVSILASSIDVILYALQGIYADSMLNVFYFIMMLWGFYKWKEDSAQKIDHVVTRLAFNVAVKLLLIGICGFLPLLLLLKYFTNSTLPFLDAITTLLSLIATYLTAKKKIENWYVWAFVDILYTWIYFSKTIYMHAGLQIIYLGMAIIGYRNWAKNEKFYDRFF